MSFNKRRANKGKTGRVRVAAHSLAATEEVEESNGNGERKPAPGTGTGLATTSGVSDGAAGGEARRKPKQKKTKKAAVLMSFGDEEAAEEDGPAFQVKKSKQSRKLARLGLKAADGASLSQEEAPAARRGAAWSSTSGEYTAAAMQALKKNTKSFSSAPASVRALPEEEPAPAPPMETEGAAPPTSSVPDVTHTHLMSREAETAIPSAHDVQLARQKRQHARDMADMIPLLDGNGALEPPEEDDTVTLTSKEMSFSEAARRRTSRDKRMEVAAALEGAQRSDDDEDDLEEDALKRWENQRIWTGVTLPTGQRTKASDPRSLAKSVAIAEGLASYRARNTATAAPKKPVSLEELERKLRSTLGSMKEVHKSHVDHLARVEGDLEAIAHNLPVLNEHLGRSSTQFRFFQESRAYLRNLLSCLDAKIPWIEEYESRVHVLWRDRAVGLEDRRHTDAHDKYNTACGRGDAETNARREARASRKRRRLGEPASSSASTGPQDLFSDDELDESALEAEHKQLEEVRAGSQAVFDDVRLEFCEIAEVMNHFKAWRKQYPDEYDNAYMALSLQKILTPLAKRQLLEWNPLVDGCADLESMGWSRDAIAYASGDRVDAAFQAQLTDEVVMPKLAGILEFVYDPLSTGQTKRAVQTVERLLTSPDREQQQEVVGAVLARLKRFAKEEPDLYIPTAMDAAHGRTGLLSFAMFLWATWLKFLSNAHLWSGVLPQSKLQDLVLSALAEKLQRPLLESLTPQDAAERYSQLVAVLPRTWFAGGGSAAVQAAQMSIQPVVRHLDGMLAMAQPGSPPHAALLAARRHLSAS